MKAVLRVVVVVGLLLVTGCGPLYNVNVSTLGTASPGSYLLWPANPNTSLNDLQFQEYAAYIHRMLQDGGFTPIDANNAQQLIVVGYGIGAPTIQYSSYSSTVYGTSSFSGTIMGPRGTQTVSGTSHGPVGTETHLVRSTVYPRHLILFAYDAERARQSRGQEQVQLWSISVVSAGSSGDLRRVMPVMVAAAERYLGEATGQSERVIVAEADKRVRELKAARLAAETTRVATDPEAPSQTEASREETQQLRADDTADTIDAGLDRHDIIAFIQFTAERHSDPNERLARLLGYLDAHYPYHKMAGVLTAADQMVSGSTVSMTQEQAACWLDDCYRRCADGKQIRRPDVFLAEYSRGGTSMSGNGTPRYSQSAVKVPEESLLVEYYLFAKKQHNDPKQGILRFLGYLDAFYPYERTSGSLQMLELLVSGEQLPDEQFVAKLTASPPEAVVHCLNECYRIHASMSGQP